MYYTKEMMASVARVEALREKNLHREQKRMDAHEINQLLRDFHPDGLRFGMDTITVGPNRGEIAPKELVRLLHAKGRVPREKIDLSHADFITDVLIIGGGGAGAAAAIEASRLGAKVLLVTKLRLGDSNTIMAEGGIQAADKEGDSPILHYLDVMGGGHFCNDPQLVRKLVMEGPEAIAWLCDMGVMFDKEADGTMATTHGGGTSCQRMHSAADYTGAEIMHSLRDEVLFHDIAIEEFTAAIEILKDAKGRAAGAILMDIETEVCKVAQAKTVILATGGSGRLHFQGFPTSNHYGATADGLVIAYRAGVSLVFQDTMQYHPTGVLFPEQLYGALVTEKVRSLGANILNAEGEPFVNPLETRDVVTAAIIRDCKERGKGVCTRLGSGVWLDFTMIEKKRGAGAIEKYLPAMFRMFRKNKVDIRQVPVLVYPTLHYQNGGLKIDANCATEVENLYAAGETTGGIHGRNRLMGNSLLDMIVYGRCAGQEAARKSKKVDFLPLTLDHLFNYERSLEDTGTLERDIVSPMLLPDYRFGRSGVSESEK